MSYNNKIEQEHRAQETLKVLREDFNTLIEEEELEVILEDQEVVDILLSNLNIHNYALKSFKLSAGGSLKIKLRKEG